MNGGNEDSSRKRPRPEETPSQRLKREKAAERQRRKRERDRAASGLGPPPMPFPPQQSQDPYSTDFTMPEPPQEDNLSPEEQARRERVRAAARERQRKHRQLVKQRKMRELGMDMGNEIMGPGIDEVHYRVNAEGQYQQVLAHELQQVQAAHAHHLQRQHAQTAQNEPPFPQGAHGGQTFATTLLLSFSCTPLLKQHLLSSLNMSNEELASLEPIIAEAWDRWDQGRRMRYDHPDGFPPGSVPPGAAAYPGPPPPGYATPGPPPTLSNPPPNPNANAGITNPHTNISNPHTPPQGSVAMNPEDFRARFQRAIGSAVPPFRTDAFGNVSNPGSEGTFQGGAGGDEGESPSAGGSSGGPQDAIDPHLGAGAGKEEMKSE
ncbi:hypothetical protein B0H16DRAFT_1511017 [Mycena metata]|uniref:Uncharacterized protein n=1 Tax=Mycena metata TaxID=1033252 RepID=A0AAD7JVS8_9AGAR|nr:hypothetical protein B0H16DRAFT_1511017 [Mycena metata]